MPAGNAAKDVAAEEGKPSVDFAIDGKVLVTGNVAVPDASEGNHAAIRDQEALHHGIGGIEDGVVIAIQEFLDANRFVRNEIGAEDADRAGIGFDNLGR